MTSNRSRRMRVRPLFFLSYLPFTLLVHTPLLFIQPVVAALILGTITIRLLIYLIASELNHYCALVIPGRKGPTPVACRVSNTSIALALSTAWLQHQPWMTFPIFLLFQITTSLPFRPSFHPFPTSFSLSYYQSSLTGASLSSSIGSTPKTISHNTDYTHPPRSQSATGSRGGRLYGTSLYSRSCRPL